MLHRASLVAKCLFGAAILWVIWEVLWVTRLSSSPPHPSPEREHQHESRSISDESADHLTLARALAALPHLNHHDSEILTWRWRKEMQWISEHIGQGQNDVCGIWAIANPFVPEGGYTMIHDTYLYFVHASIRMVNISATLEGDRHHCPCKKLLLFSDAVALTQYKPREDILTVMKRRCGVTNAILWLLSPNSLAEEEIHQQALQRGISSFDFVFYHRWTPVSREQEKKVMWLPLGYSVGMTPAAYPQLLPASERKCLYAPWNKARSLNHTQLIPEETCTQVPSEPPSRTLQLLESVFFVCPSNASRAETHKIWEALDAGAIPLVLAASNHPDFNGLPTDSPLIFLPDTQKLYQFLSRAKNLSTEELNALQQKTLRWWLRYKLSLQFRVADVINSLLNIPVINDRGGKASFATDSHDAWMDLMIRQWSEVARPKQTLHVTWTHDPDFSYEYGVTFNRYLGMVPSSVRMCRLSAYSADNTACCGHVLLDLLIAAWWGGVPANYTAFALRPCVRSVGLIVHGNEYETNITFLLMHKGRMIMDYVMHNYFGPTEYTSKSIWLPLGYTHWIPPVSPSHIVPASRRRWLCGFRGTFHIIERQEMRDEFAREKKLRCTLEESKNGASRLQYREDLLSMVVAICPRGGGPDTFRLWEALDAGAIPLVVRHPVYASLPENNPILWVDDWRDFKKEVMRLHELPLEELDKLQQLTVSWWYSYNRRLQLRIANTIYTAMQKGEKDASLRRESGGRGR